MKKYTLSPAIIVLLEGYENYSKSKGVKPLLFSQVYEFKIGKKYAYRLSSKVNETYVNVIKQLSNQYISRIPINQSAIAYRKNKSYFDFIEPHRNNYFFLRLDLKSFFHSITETVIKAHFLEYFSDEKLSRHCDQTHAEAIYNLITFKLTESSNNKQFKGKDILPMGFPLSPVISNIIFRKLDLLIEKYCDEKGITYTRYADDMLFSSKGTIKPINPFNLKVDKKYNIPFLLSKKFYDEISYLLGLDGYKLNKSKIIKSVHTISLNGYTITGTNYSDIKGSIRISNRKTKIIDKLLHELKVNSDDTAVFKKCFTLNITKFNSEKVNAKFIDEYCSAQINNKLVGYKSYIISLIKYNKAHNCLVTDIQDKYLKLIKKLEVVIKKRTH